jgi:hypothetical protein
MVFAMRYFLDPCGGQRPVAPGLLLEEESFIGSVAHYYFQFIRRGAARDILSRRFCFHDSTPPPDMPDDDWIRVSDDLSSSPNASGIKIATLALETRLPHEKMDKLG